MHLLSPEERPIAVTFDALEPPPDREAGDGVKTVRCPLLVRPPAAGPRGDRAGNHVLETPGVAATTRAPAPLPTRLVLEGYWLRWSRWRCFERPSRRRRLVRRRRHWWRHGRYRRWRSRGKVVLGTGEGGQGSRTPGRGGIGGAGADWWRGAYWRRWAGWRNGLARACAHCSAASDRRAISERRAARCWRARHVRAKPRVATALLL